MSSSVSNMRSMRMSVCVFWGWGGCVPVNIMGLKTIPGSVLI